MDSHQQSYAPTNTHTSPRLHGSGGRLAPLLSLGVRDTPPPTWLSGLLLPAALTTPRGHVLRQTATVTGPLPQVLRRPLALALLLLAPTVLNCTVGAQSRNCNPTTQICLLCCCLCRCRGGHHPAAAPTCTVSVHSPDLGFHTRSDASPSPPPVTTALPSGVKPPQDTGPLCPENTCGSGQRQQRRRWRQWQQRKQAV